MVSNRLKLLPPPLNHSYRRAAFLLQVGRLMSFRLFLASLERTQAPLLLISFILVSLKVNIKLPQEIQNESTYSKLRRIDFLGSFTLAGAVGGLLLGFSLKTTEELPWSHPLIWGLFGGSAVFWVAFILVEAHWAPYPVMPLRLITQRTPLAVSLANFLGSISAFSMVSAKSLYKFTLIKAAFLLAIQHPLVFLRC